MGVINSVKFEFLSMPENIGFSRVCSAAFASQLDCTLEEVEEVKLAVSEAVSNCIIHGYGNRKDGRVMMELNLYQGNTLELIVEDAGVGIADIQQAMTPSFSTDPERMGLGFALMQSFMDELEVVSEPGRGTRVRMIKTFVPMSDGLAS
jgi:stage II sporulation protein AB (anti-sigma F factor)